MLFIGDNPQAMIMMVSKINGDQALKICPLVYLFHSVTQRESSLANLQIAFGLQNFRKIIRKKIEPMPARISGREGPKKFEQAHCIAANENPDTNIAGNTSFVFFESAH